MTELDSASPICNQDYSAMRSPGCCTKTRIFFLILSAPNQVCVLFGGVVWKKIWYLGFCIDLVFRFCSCERACVCLYSFPSVFSQPVFILLDSDFTRDAVY